ncbi:MAG: lysophospholipid acyltransferase family protein [Pseudomonadota bacterium]
MMVVLFNIFFWIFAFAYMAVLALATMALRLFFTYPQIHSRVPAAGFRHIILFVTLGRFRVTFDPAFDPERLSVFCFNHTNLLDGHTTSASIPHAFCGLMNAWQFWIPFYGWLMKLSRGIPIRKKDFGRNLERITEHALQRRRENMSILVFPEGHRTPDGRVHRFHKGSILMARDAGYPVVPAGIRGMYAVNQRGSYLFRPGPVSVHFGPQIETAGLSDSGISDLTRKLQEMVMSYVESPEEVSSQREAVNT